LMHPEVATYPVPGAVIIVEPLLPQRAARKGVELCPSGSFGETRQGQRDMALQHAGETVAHLLSRLADRHRARHIGRAVNIVRAGIEQVEGAWFEAFLGFR